VLAPEDFLRSNDPLAAAYVRAFDDRRDIDRQDNDRQNEFRQNNDKQGGLDSRGAP
jgi:hypothetical protein